MLFYCFLERERKSRRGGDRKTSVGCLLICAWTWGRTCKLGMCPDQESNPGPFSLQTTRPANLTTLTRAAAAVFFFFKLLSFFVPGMHQYSPPLLHANLQHTVIKMFWNELEENILLLSHPGDTGNYWFAGDSSLLWRITKSSLCPPPAAGEQTLPSPATISMTQMQRWKGPGTFSNRTGVFHLEELNKIQQLPSY